MARKPAATGITEQRPGQLESDTKPKGSNREPPLWYQGILEKDDAKLRDGVKLAIDGILLKHGLQDYCTLFLFDEQDSITNFHADALYSAASALKDNPKDILLLINSRGGSIEPAYLISKALKRLSKQKFAVAVPRRAKSAATLIALGADEIHMGLMSELGPIDPQIGGLPALALGNALDVIAGLASRFPESSQMFGSYISEQVQIRTLGYYQRVSESAVQYAERLLANRLEDNRSPQEVATKLVNHYKDHSFVIDVNESIELLGNSIVKEETVEYKAADEIYKFLVTVDRLIDRNKYYWLVGLSDQFYLSTRPQN